MASRKRKGNVVPSDSGVPKWPLLDYSDNEDVVGEILTWLPTKSLLRFRSVCKTWKDLFSRPCFVNKHLTRGPAVSRIQILERDYDDIEFDPPANRKLRNIPCSTDMFSLKVGKGPAIVGSCNGLMCLRVSEEKGLFLLWNPCTGETKMLPEPKSFPYIDFYGFGYDFATKDYKVIVGSTSSWPPGLPFYESDSSTTKVAVFTLRTGSWRTDQGLEILYLIGKGCLLNGSLHWLEREPEHFHGYKIVSFDLEKEEIQAVVPLPTTVNSMFSIPSGIGSTRTSLVICYSYFGDRWEDEMTPFTIMKEISGGQLRRHGFTCVDSISILERGEV